MQQMSLLEEAPARRSASPDSGRLWTIHAAGSCSNISELAQKLIRNGSYGRTCPEYCRLNADGPSSRSLRPWPNSGLMGWAAWRVLDAQFFGVAQRRRRVFLVVNTRDWRRAAPVLFERESLCWDYLSSREKRQSLTQGTDGGVGGADSDAGNVMCRADTQANAAQGFDLSPTLMAHAGKDAPFIYPTTNQSLHTEGSMNGLTVRRLTPLECERIQGFPDGWTDIPWKGKKHAPDSPRYKALGNSMAVPVMRWIGEGIQLVEDNK